MSFTIPLPRYRCHKTVSALKIAAVIPNPRGAELHFDDRRYAPHQVANAWVARHDPCEGSYLVIYDDGYQSVSPPEAFEAGYTLIDDGPRAKFADEPCQGANCGATDGVSHSAECFAEHEAVISGGAV